MADSSQMEVDGTRSWRTLLVRFWPCPADLTGVLALVVLTAVSVFHPELRETPIRLVVGLPFLLFLPGYALVAALFPERGQSAAERRASELHRFEQSAESIQSDGISGVARVALSFGVSVAVVSLAGLALSGTPWGIRLMPVVVTLGVFIVGCTAVATYRRLALPPNARFAVPYRQWYAGIRDELRHPETRVDVALNVFLILGVLVAAAGVAYAIAPPQDDEGDTEFDLLTRDDNGTLVADGYPTELEVGESAPVVVGVTNREGESVEYSVVVQLQEVAIDRSGDDARATVTRREELDRFGTELANDQTWRRTYQFTPAMTGENLRLTFLLYDGDPPSEPTSANAYREVHLWTNVTASGE